MNLTKLQQEDLRWILEQVKDRKLSEGDIKFCRHEDGWYYLNGMGFKVQLSTLYAWKQEELLVSSIEKETVFIFGLTKKAYEVVDSNFNAPDRSAVPHLTSLLNIENLDPKLWDRCKYSLSASGEAPEAWDKAVRSAMVVLEERLRRIAKLDKTLPPNATGQQLINHIFSQKSSLLSDRLDDGQKTAYRNLYAGMMGVFRNSYGHQFVDPQPQEGGAIIVFTDLLLKMLDSIDWKEND